MVSSSAGSKKAQEHLTRNMTFDVLHSHFSSISSTSPTAPYYWAPFVLTGNWK